MTDETAAKRCVINPVSSAVCELGTKSCEVQHAAKPLDAEPCGQCECCASWRASLLAAQREVAELTRQRDNARAESDSLYSEAPCPNCGATITGACWGCLLKDARERVAALEAKQCAPDHAMLIEACFNYQVKLDKLEAALAMHSLCPTCGGINAHTLPCAYYEVLRGVLVAGEDTVMCGDLDGTKGVCVLPRDHGSRHRYQKVRPAVDSDQGGTPK